MFYLRFILSKNTNVATRLVNISLNRLLFAMVAIWRGGSGPSEDDVVDRDAWVAFIFQPPRPGGEYCNLGARDDGVDPYWDRHFVPRVRLGVQVVDAEPT